MEELLAWWSVPWAQIGQGSIKVAIWVVTVLFLLAGLAGTIVPALPGPLIILVGAVLHVLAYHFFLQPQNPGLHWPGLLVLLLFVVISQVLDFFSSAVGSKIFGGSKWGVWGALVGGIFGIFGGLPGLFIGPVIGALVFELAFAKKELRPAAKSSMGTFVGTTTGMMMKVGVGIAMIIYFMCDIFLLRW
jgi:uncharacterized protein